MRLIKEESYSTNDMEVLVEGAGSSKKLYIRGPFLQSEKVNRNNRVYPKSVMESAVKKYQDEYIAKSRALGELNHPAEPVVNPERAAILTTKLEEDGIYYVGTAKVLSTPMGKIVENLINDGVTVGVSSRGLGSLRQTREGYNMVGNDFVLTTAADVVFDPSAQSSFVEGVYEGAAWVMESNGCFKRMNLEEERDLLKQAKKAELLDKKLDLFERFMNELKGL